MEGTECRKHGVVPTTHLELSRRIWDEMVNGPGQDLVADHRRHLAGSSGLSLDRLGDGTAHNTTWALMGNLCCESAICRIWVPGISFAPGRRGAIRSVNRSAEHLSEHIDRYGAPLGC